MDHLESGPIKTVCEVLHTPVGFKGKLSVPGWGTKYSAPYPDRDDAVAALVDLRREAYGPHVAEAALPAIEFA